MTPPTQGKKLLEQMRDQIRVKQYSFRTEKTYLHWAREYFLYHNPELKQGKVAKHPIEMGASEIINSSRILSQSEKSPPPPKTRH